MSLRLNHPALNLILFDESFIVYKIPVREEIPADILTILTEKVGSEELVSITCTSEEISIVCNATKVPDVSAHTPHWKCIKFKGPLDFGLTGILCSVSTPLKSANISIFAISTWDTDYVLIPEGKAEEAVNVLKNDGWKFENKCSGT
ncbi:hypothetical protein ACEPAG_555 [Sanghuangporus baumii]